MDLNYAVSPGEYLQEWLDDTSTTQQQAAERLGYSRKHINEIVNGRAVVTPETATRLHRLTGIPVASWLTFEAAYRANLTRLRDQAELAPYADNIPSEVATYLRLHGHTTATRANPGLLVSDFLTFHGCGTFEAYVDEYERATHGEFALAALRESKRDWEPAAMSTWLRAAERTETYHASRSLDFDEGAVRDLLPALRERCATPNEALLADAATMLRRAGVLLMFVEPPKKFPLHGVTRWIDDRVPVIQQTGRRCTDGFIIWTLFHEIGHVLNDPRGEMHVEYPTERKRNTAAEKAANAFAMKTLLGEDELAPFRGQTSDRDIASTSRSLGISPGLAVLLMRRKRYIPYSYGSRLTVDLQPDFSI